VLLLLSFKGGLRGTEFAGMKVPSDSSVAHFGRADKSWDVAGADEGFVKKSD
jgi:hypothetical protein